MSKLFSPAAWKRVGNRTARLCHGAWQRRRLDRLYRRLGPVARGVGSPAIIADGLWDNPNHFFRLRLFLEALPEIASLRPIGILRRTGDRTRQALERLGFRDFIAIEETAFEPYLAQAEAMLEPLSSHRELLELALPGALPAYTYYDSVLKRARHPQPPLDDPLWRTTLAACLRNCALYGELLDATPVAHVVLSHPWESEFATLVWAALARGIPVYHLTGYCEGIRIRRFREPDDYATPVERLSRSEFEALPEAVQNKLSEAGERYLARREMGAGSDINSRHAFRPTLRAPSRAEARRAFGVEDGRKLGIVYSHVWFDFPHTFAMGNFTDFLDWMRFTIDCVSDIRGMDWLLKPHPTEAWYGGFGLADLVGELPPHVRLAPRDTDSLSAMTAADVVVTVHGTVGLEASAHGVAVIAADHSFYSDWGFVHRARSRDHYRELLQTAGELSAPDEAARRRALALIALALAPTPDSLAMRCDSSGPVLYSDIIQRYNGAAEALTRERGQMADWLRGSSSSYAAHVKTGQFSP